MKPICNWIGLAQKKKKVPNNSLMYHRQEFGISLLAINWLQNLKGTSKIFFIRYEMLYNSPQ